MSDCKHRAEFIRYPNRNTETQHDEAYCTACREQQAEVESLQSRINDLQLELIKSEKHVSRLNGSIIEFGQQFDAKVEARVAAALTQAVDVALRYRHGSVRGIDLEAAMMALVNEDALAKIVDERVAAAYLDAASYCQQWLEGLNETGSEVPRSFGWKEMQVKKVFFVWEGVAKRNSQDAVDALAARERAAETKGLERAAIIAESKPYFYQTIADKIRALKEKV